jgi:hypothetical protein
MRVRMLVGLSGADYCLQPNDERDFPADEALRFIERGYAVPVAAPIERAVKKPVETRKRKK